MTVEDRLRRAVPPDAEGAEARAWAVVRSSATVCVTNFATITKIVTRTGAAAALVVLFALSGAGAATKDWVADTIAPTTKPAQVLPFKDRTLIADSRGLAIIRPDGRRLQLSAADGATWSPNGLFIAVWQNKDLRALEPDGGPRWRITAPADIKAATWSPDGLRIAYVAGNQVRIVSGNGTNDHRLLNEATRSPRLAWNPARPQELAYTTTSGHTIVRDVGTGQRVERAKASRWLEAARVVTVLPGP